MIGIDLDAQAERDAADIRTPWAGYQWKVRELIARAQAAEAEVRRLQAENKNLRTTVDEDLKYQRRLEARVAELEAGIRRHEKSSAHETLEDEALWRLLPVTDQGDNSG